MKFSDNLRMLRAKYKLSQQDIGEIVGLTSQAVSKWENDIAQPDNDSLIKLAKYFNVSIDFLLGIEKDDEEKGNEANSVRNNNKFDELEKLFKKNRDILTEDDEETIRFLIEKRIRDIDKQNHNE